MAVRTDVAVLLGGRSRARRGGQEIIMGVVFAGAVAARRLHLRPIGAAPAAVAGPEVVR